MREHRILALLVGVLVTATAGWGQSNDVVDALLAEERATLGGSAYLVLTAAGLLDESATVEDAVADLRGRSWGFQEATAQDPVTVGSLAYMSMRAFELKGGLLYSVFPGRRYAAREFGFLGFVPGSAAPRRPLAGREVTHVVGMVLESLGQRTIQEVAP